MKKRILCLMLCLVLSLVLCPALVRAEEPASFMDDVEADSLGVIIRTYDAPTLKYTVEKFLMDREMCYLVRIWVQDPSRQIKKATAEWQKKLRRPADMAESIPGAALAINGSGYVSPRYPDIPEEYPGESKDYFYTPLGSLTVTDGEVLRNLDGVAYCGLTLDENGLEMYTGEENARVLETNPLQTWAFYPGCAMLRNNEDILPKDWAFADRRAARTIVARQDRNRYLILSVSSERKHGISLRRAAEFFLENFRTEWVYNLDGGPSSALLCRNRDSKKIRVLAGGGSSDADMMVFVE